MHTIKITPTLLLEYQCTSGKFIRLPNRIESKLFWPELECSTIGVALMIIMTEKFVRELSYKFTARSRRIVQYTADVSN